jgi:hypothetical protein
MSEARMRAGARTGSGRGWSSLALRGRALLVALFVALPSRAQVVSDELPEASIDPARVAAALDAIANGTPPDFCQRRDYRLQRSEAALCSLAPAARARCPEFAAACARVMGGAPRPAAEGPRSTESPWLQLLGAILRVLGLALLAGLAALCVLALVRLVRGSSASRRREPADDKATPGSTRSAGDAELEGPEPHLARARALAAAGAHARALVELHLGVVSSLDAQGVLRARPGRTNGDYARELASKPELLAPFRELTRAVEAVQFGSAPLDAGGFQRLLGRAAPLLSALLLALIVGLGAFGCDGEAEKPAAAEACGSGADGHSLLCQVLEATGSRVRRRYRSLEGLADASSDVDVVVLLRSELEAKGTRALEAWLRQGGVLVLTTPLSELDRQLGVERSPQPCGADAKVAGNARSLAAIGPGLRAPQLEASALCGNGDAFIARGRYDEGWVAVVSSPAVLSNASLAAGDNAALLVPLLFPADAVIDLVGSWTRDEPENPLGQLRAAGLLPWLLQLMALGLCYGLYRGQPFARRRAPPEVGRRRFSEHAQALGQRWAEAGAAGAALKAYASWATEQLRERLPIGTEQTVAGLAQVISEKTGKPPEAVARTLERARRAQLGAEPTPEVSFGEPLPPRELPDEAEQLATLKSLGRLLEEIGGSR